MGRARRDCSRRVATDALAASELGLSEVIIIRRRRRRALLICGFGAGADRLRSWG